LLSILGKFHVFYQLPSEEKCTFSGALPTVWLMLINHMQENDLMLSDLERVVIGGSARQGS